MSSYDGLWAGPGHDGANEYPVVEMIIVVVCTIIFTVIVGGIATWKSKDIEHFLERMFYAIGKKVGTWPITTLAITLFILFGLSSGMSMQESEVDAALLWVPTGSVSLEHKDYVSAAWPSQTMPTFVMAVPDSDETGENILTPGKVQILFAKHQELMQITVDGDKIVEVNKAIEDFPASNFAGTWTFGGEGTTRAKCFSFWGTSCAQNSVLSMFNYDAAMIGSLTQQQLVDRVTLWDTTPKDSMLPGVMPPIYKNFEAGDVLGGIGRDGSGKITSCKVFSLSMFSKLDEQMAMDGGDKQIVDPVAVAWEADAICALGVQDNHPIKKETTCAESKGLKYHGFFQRSFSDEFGGAIKSDVLMIIVAYYAIIIYLVLNLGKRDNVHGMVGMSGVCILCVGLSFSAGSGLGGMFGIKTNPLNGNIPFLLLGLGVDDAFVLGSELFRHMLANPEDEPSELVAKTAMTGGLSVLVTSLTDALAFLVGGSTKLPALSGFCLYAGICVVFCFITQMVVFLPALALDARRRKANRYDCGCCCTAYLDHKLDDPQCCCCGLGSFRLPDNLIRKGLDKSGRFMIKTTPGRIITIVVWFVIFVCGCVGLTGIEKNFKLEWFFPDDSYVNRFIDISDQYFAVGTNFNFYTSSKMDIYARQGDMNELTSYIRGLDLLTQGQVDNWWYVFTSGTPAEYTDKAVFYTALYTWFSGNGGSAYRGSLQWVDSNCQTMTAACDPQKGVDNTRIGARLVRFESGGDRFRALHKMREDVKVIFADDSGEVAFPYAYDMLFWEEFGIIDQELVRNLIVASGLIFSIICMLIPRLNVALLVSTLICMSIGEVVGFAHFWGVTINGPSTIYLLICVGLAVDYSAHIAHVFKSQQDEDMSLPREDIALAALTRIGPSVFQALLSTILALAVLAFSKSYVFRIFFKVLFLVTMIAGFKGLWLLPVLLGLPLPGSTSSSKSVDAEKAQTIDISAEETMQGQLRGSDSYIVKQISTE